MITEIYGKVRISDQVGLGGSCPLSAWLPALNWWTGSPLDLLDLNDKPEIIVHNYKPKYFGFWLQKW